MYSCIIINAALSVTLIIDKTTIGFVWEWAYYGMRIHGLIKTPA